MMYLDKSFCNFFKNWEQFQEMAVQNAAWLVISAQLHTDLKCKNIHGRGWIPLFQIIRTPATQYQSNEFWNSVIYVPHINTW